MDDPWVQAVKKLYELTEADKLHWEVVDTFVGDPKPLGKVYSTEVKERRIVAYEILLPVVVLPYQKPSFFNTLDRQAKKLPETVIVIQFVDDHWQPQWRWPGTAEAWKLWDSIKFQVAAGPGFLEALLAT